ncbi:MAG: hypothetical protein K2H29_04290 [Oscillospiraceae bacterium]|nr:hypothetical protein [Oscillospiraceae bacterium]
MQDKISTAKKIMIVVLLLLFFVSAIYLSFTHLLKPDSSLNARTLGQISNSYEEARALKGNIYDRNNELLLGNIILNEDGEMELLSEQDRFLQEQADYKRLLLSEDSACWSNILPVLCGGLDSSFSNILQDIPLDSENPEENTDISLTIDGNLQSEIYEILSGRNYSSAVVMDCNTGDLLAMVSRPSYVYNTFREGSIPYTSYVDNGQFFNNVDNAHDCVQDYYKLFRNAYEEDNVSEKNIQKWQEGRAVRALRTDLTESRLLFSESEAQKQLDYWNMLYHSNFSLQDCVEINFAAIYQDEQAFYEFSSPGEYFTFHFEPESLGSGLQYIPFIRITIPDAQGTQTKYLKLCYGNNNFIYQDCVNHEFDPNFSFQNSALTTSAPGSCFKILLTAMLADEADSSLFSEQDNGVRTIAVSNQYQASEKSAPLPTVETSRRNHTDLVHALSESSNQYFSMAAILLDRILGARDSYICNYQNILDLDTASIQHSGALLQNYYEQKFYLNQEIDSYFHVPAGRILSCLNSIQIGEKPENAENLLSYDVNLWYTLNEKQEIEQAYTDSKISLAQKIGDTAYGQGYNRISPVFMAMCMSKCLTGEMHMPNVLLEESGKSEMIGEPFDRTSDTVSFMKNALSAVYDHHTGYTPEDLSFTQNDFTFYSKTGTSSVDKGEGTQSTYGLFAQCADYPTQKEDDAKYQIIWYVGAVSDGTDCYAIVLRSYFDNESYSLKNEFLRIVDSLHQHGYLQKNS